MTGGQPPTPEEIQSEQRKIRQLRILVDLVSNLIMQGQLSQAEAEQLVEAARARILKLFPGKEETYDLIYRPRFARLIREFVRIRAASRDWGDRG